MSQETDALKASLDASLVTVDATDRDLSTAQTKLDSFIHAVPPTPVPQPVSEIDDLKAQLAERDTAIAVLHAEADDLKSKLDDVGLKAALLAGAIPDVNAPAPPPEPVPAPEPTTTPAPEPVPEPTTTTPAPSLFPEAAPRE